MASARDVAAFILSEQGGLTTWKLQKLVYYSQAWSLVWDDEPLFPEPIQAWANGPVVRDLYDAHRGEFGVDKIVGGDATRLTPTQKETVRSVLRYYGDRSSQYLSDLTHMERPWRETRQGIPEDERSTAVITQALMAEYYGSLLPEDS